MHGHHAGGRRLRAAAVAATLLATSVAWAAGTAGTLDATFGSGGVALDLVPTGSSIEAMGLQSTGKIVSVRSASGTLPNGTKTNVWSFRRYLADGSRDSTFGTSGETTVFGTDGDVVRHMVVDSADRIVAVGRSKVTVAIGGTLVPVTVVRLTADGALDTSFGSGGIARPAVTGTPYPQAVAVQADQILIAGHVTVGAGTKRSPSNYALFLLRLTSAGVLDGSFGSGGITVHNPTSLDDDVYPGAIALQSDGGILLGGRRTSSSQWVLTRYLSSGAVDTAFATVARATAFLRGLSVDASDRILVCGYSGVPSPVVVGRYLPGGTLDATYGSGGYASASTSTHVEAAAIRALAGGGALVTATVGTALPRGVTAVRFQADGTVDSGFSGAGFGTVVSETDVDYFAGIGMAVDGFGNPIAVGERQKSTNPRSTHVFLVRWLGN